MRRVLFGAAIAGSAIISGSAWAETEGWQVPVDALDLAYNANVSDFGSLKQFALARTSCRPADDIQGSYCYYANAREHFSYNAQHGTGAPSEISLIISFDEHDDVASTLVALVVMALDPDLDAPTASDLVLRLFGRVTEEGYFEETVGRTLFEVSRNDRMQSVNLMLRNAAIISTGASTWVQD